MRHALALLVSLFALAGCGAGETAATASLQAEQASQAQQQMARLQQQIDEANRQSNQRLEEALRASQ
ncbi:hypothetical protein [Stutzerimonas nosocomialis]|uniref:hypothetical protein n=1 Tax=Stutzerimonas nosocomialis TaxID=1056496 RepID=UPI0015768FE8|nr:hypothetical protein [Stutzerimonas nosocomialis]